MNDPAAKNMGTLDWATVHDLIDTFSVSVLKCKLCANYVTTQRNKIIAHISERHTTFQAGMVVITGNEQSQETNIDGTLEELSDICEIGFTSWCNSGGHVQDCAVKTVSDATLDIISEAALSAQVVSEIESVKDGVENDEGSSSSHNAGTIHVHGGESSQKTSGISAEEDRILSPVEEGLSMASGDNSDSDNDDIIMKDNDIVTSTGSSESSQVINVKEPVISSPNKQDIRKDSSVEVSVEHVNNSSKAVKGSNQQDQENPRRLGLRTPGQRKRKIFQDCATEHNQEVSADMQYKCQKCDFTTDHVGSLKGHECSHKDGKSKTPVCLKCKTRFSDMRSLREHTSSCSTTGKDVDDSGDIEDKDGERFSDDGVRKGEDVKISKKRKRQRKPPPQSPQPCQLCGFICQSEISLKIHMHKHKESRAPRTYSCDDCGKKYTTQMGVSRHKLNWCRGDKQRPHVSYTCSVCDKLFQNKMIYREHLTVHSAIRNHKCDVCSKSFKTNRALHRHTTNKHTGVSYKCSLCDFETNWKGSLKTHCVTKHDSESRPLQKCPECSFTTRSALYITKHIMTHRDERPYMCEHCGKSFKADTVLRAHLEMHDDSKRYPCDKCEYVGSSRGALYSHRASHISKEQMRYKCQLCDWVGRRKTELQIHQRKHSAMKLFRCGHCGQSYKHKHGLTRHLKEKHMVQTVMQTEVVFPDYEMEYTEDPTLALSSLPVAQFFEISTEILADSS